jgi:hypothetical protein
LAFKAKRISWESKRKGKKYGILNGFCPEREINLGLKIVSKLSLTYWLVV